MSRHAQWKSFIRFGEGAVGNTQIRRDIVRRLRQMEIIEGLLEFDLVSLQLYADSVAEQRQRLTQELSRYESGD